MQTFTVPYAFNEQTIFLAFIKYCNFKNTIPISEDISTICSVKPDYINLSDTSSEIIMKLKTHNQSYPEEQMKRLLQIVNRNNIIQNTNVSSLVVETETTTPESILTDILERNDFEDEDLHQFIPVLQEYLMTNDFENLDRFLVITTDAIQSRIIEFLKKYGKKKEIQNSIDFLTKMIEETSKINTINNLNYIKSCIKMIGKILPGMIKNTVVYDIKVHPHVDIIGSHKENILKISTEEYISIKKYYEDPTLNSEFLTNIQRIFSEIILLSDKIIINNSNFTHQVSLKLMKYFFVIGLYKYITNSKDLTEEEGSVVVELNARENLQNTKVASLVIDFIKILSNHQEKINISYEEIMNKIFKSKESEKNGIRKSRSTLSTEALKIDNEFKALKIGKWGKGQNVTGYDGERYEIENQMMQQHRMETEALLQFDNPNPNQDIDEGDQAFVNGEDGDYMNDYADNENDE
jgi:predicted metal-binding transcription factor (methanogenesis marker protein 9)